MINLPNLICLRDIERIREQSTYGNHSFGLLLYSLVLAKCQDITKREQEIAQAEPRRIVEIGYFIGYSALMLTAGIAESGKSGKVISIDLHDQELGRYNMAIQYPLPSYHQIVIGDSVDAEDAVMTALGGPIDILLIDGDHSYQGCKRDFEAYSPHLADDGLLLFHDNYNPDVRKVIDEVEGFELVSLGGWASLTAATRKRYCWNPVN